MNAHILVCCHKSDVMATQYPYFPIHVGKSLSKTVLPIQSDNEGDNISEKNSSYCELTGIYWAWKNLKNIDVIGLCHYRRYFDFHNQCKNFLPYTNFPSSQFDQVDLSIPNSVLESIHDNDIIVAEPRIIECNVAHDYCFSHVSDDFRILQSVFETTQDENMIAAFYEVMYGRNELSPFNMFIMKWNDFSDYCEWLFDILYRVESLTSISNYNNVQKRIYGYMAERLLNVYITAKHMSVKKRKVIFFSDIDEHDSSLKFLIKKWRFRMGVGLTCPTKKTLRRKAKEVFSNKKR